MNKIVFFLAIIVEIEKISVIIILFKDNVMGIRRVLHQLH